MNKTVKLFLPVLCLLAIGIAYAHWSENLYVNGQVETGEVDWGFLPPIIWSDPTGSTGDFALDPSIDEEGFTFYLTKDVASTDVDIYDTDGDGDFDTMEVHIYNAYPCYYGHIGFDARVGGTVPIKIWKVVINGVEFYENNIYDSFDLNGDGEDDIEFWWPEYYFGAQLHPGDKVDTSFSFHILQPCPEGETLTFTIEFIAVQYNLYEVPTS